MLQRKLCDYNTEEEWFSAYISKRMIMKATVLRGIQTKPFISKSIHFSEFRTNWKNRFGESFLEKQKQNLLNWKTNTYLQSDVWHKIICRIKKNIGTTKQLFMIKIASCKLDIKTEMDRGLHRLFVG